MFGNMVRLAYCSRIRSFTYSSDMFSQWHDPGQYGFIFLRRGEGEVSGDLLYLSSQGHFEKKRVIFGGLFIRVCFDGCWGGRGETDSVRRNA